jgi:ABC-type Zn2+ transport system substrate-binding protein/surface adhesin
VILKLSHHIHNHNRNHNHSCNHKHNHDRNCDHKHNHKHDHNLIAITIAIAISISQSQSQSQLQSFLAGAAPYDDVEVEAATKTHVSGAGCAAAVRRVAHRLRLRVASSDICHGRCGNHYQ